VLDKTGTITTGTMAVVSVLPFGSTSRADLLAAAAAVESGSEHPVARAVVAQAGSESISPVESTSFSAEAGQGVQALVGGKLTLAGRASWLSDSWSIALSPDACAAIRSGEDAAATVIAVAWDGELRGIITVRDAVKPTSAEAITRYRALGLRPVLLTGDNAGSARTVAAEVGIDEVHAGVTPQGKLDLIHALQAEGRVVAMVGDGVNDSAALAAADLGIAMGGGTDAAIAASDITVVSGDLLVVADAVRLARRTLGTIKGNLFWAFAYNVAAIPIAMLGLLNPLLAGAAMAFSSVFVVTNSLRLRRFAPARRR
jgi:Cu+-exporting ATPase